NVFAGPFEQAEYATGRFDAVTMWDVLEHLHDPLASLREVRRIVRPGGLLFVRVPDAGSIMARLCGDYWSGYDLPRHMTMFTLPTLLRMLAASGFDWPQTIYWSGSYLAALHSLRFALDDGRLPPEQAAQLHRALQTAPVRVVAWLPFRLADWLGQGSNMEVLSHAQW
ncbi:MAG: class I SAM-dependent methyltransferase, partial [Chloroflexaceae bacterium]|nr:class I SAM-dependent methyltransferase [Chloroflexaceae bacterium]